MRLLAFRAPIGTLLSPRARGLSRVGFVFALLLVVSGCGAREAGRSPEWTEKEGALNLTEILRAGDDEPYFFGSIRDVTIGPGGLVYIADAKNAHVKVLSPDGTLRDRIGQSGMGPGEFRRPADVYVSRRDSVYILDGDFRGLLSVFGPNHQFVRRTSVRSKYVPDRPADILHISQSSGYLMDFSSLPDPQEGRSKNTVRWVDSGGTLGDTLFAYTPSTQPVEKTERGLRFYNVPYIRSGEVRGAALGTVHYAWEDSLGIQSYGPGGEMERTIDIPFEPVPVTEADLDRKLPTRSEAEIADLKQKGYIATTKPAFEHFLVDDEGRYWFGRPTAHPDTTAWWVADPEVKRVATARLPADVDLTAVRGGYAYGDAETEAGAPVVVRYRVNVQK